jgi:hypothetical protein
MIKAAEGYQKLGDENDAQKALKLASKVAERFFAKDTDADDPNQAFKGAWPSTNLWRRIVIAAGHISQRLPGQILGEIPDPDIATFAKAAYGDSLLGVSVRYEVNIQHKSGEGNSMRVSE